MGRIQRIIAIEELDGDRVTTVGTLGKQLQRYRELAGFTQQQLAKRSGYSTDYISKLERGLREPPRAALARLAGVLGLSEQVREELWRLRQSSSTATIASTPITGRAIEQAEIGRHLDGLAPPVLLLAGEPGIGKSRLLEEAAAIGAHKGWRVVRGGCRPRAQDPYAPLVDALASSIEDLATDERAAALRDAQWLGLLLPELVTSENAAGPSAGQVGWAQTGLPPEQQRRLLFATVHRYLQAVAGEAGTLLILDDLQWAGSDALDLLSALLDSGNAARAGNIRLVGAYRDTDATADAPLSSFVADLARSARARVLALTPLQRADAEALVGQLLSGGPDGGTSREVLVPAIVRRAGGVPFFLVSYVEDVRRHRQTESTVELPLELPWTVAQVIRQRVGALPETARELLAAAAAMERTISHVLLALVTGRSEEEALAALEAAAEARLLTEDGEQGYCFTHDLIRETIEGELSAPRRRLLHRRMGEALERDARAPIESLAFHFSRSDEHEKAARYLERAGDQAQRRLAHAAAASFFRQALMYPARRPHDTAAIEEKLGTLLCRMGLFADGIAALERALLRLRTAGDASGAHHVIVSLLGARYLLNLSQLAAQHSNPSADAGVGDPDAGDPGPRQTAAIRKAIRGAPGTTESAGGTLEPTAVPGELEDWRAPLRRLFAIGRTMRRQGRMSGDESTLRNGMHAEGAALLALDHLVTGMRALEGALPADPAPEERHHIASLAVLLGSAYVGVGQWERCEHLCARILPVAEALGDPHLLATFVAYRGATLHAKGDWASAAVLLRRADELYAAAAPSIYSVNLTYIRAPSLLEAGQWEEARAYLEAALRSARAMGAMHAERTALTHLAELDVLAGEPEGAIARVASLAESDLRWIHACRLRSVLAAAYLALGDPSRAQVLAAAAVATARGNGAWTQGLAALRIQGAVAAHLGETDHARAAYGEGLQRARAMPYPYAEAQLLAASSALDHQCGDEAAAAVKRAEAQAILRRLGVNVEAIPALQTAPN